MSPDPAPLAPDPVQTGILRLVEMADMRQLRGEERHMRLHYLRGQLERVDALIAAEQMQSRHRAKHGH